MCVAAAVEELQGEHEWRRLELEMLTAVDPRLPPRWSALSKGPRTIATRRFTALSGAGRLSSAARIQSPAPKRSLRKPCARRLSWSKCRSWPVPDVQPRTATPKGAAGIWNHKVRISWTF